MSHSVIPVKNAHDSDVKYHVIRNSEFVASYDTQREAEEHVTRLDRPSEVKHAQLGRRK
jgi:hypothetical protein